MMDGRVHETTDAMSTFMASQETIELESRIFKYGMTVGSRHGVFWLGIKLLRNMARLHPDVYQSRAETSMEISHECYPKGSGSHVAQ